MKLDLQGPGTQMGPFLFCLEVEGPWRLVEPRFQPTSKTEGPLSQVPGFVISFFVLSFSKVQVLQKKHRSESVDGENATPKFDSIFVSGAMISQD